MQSIVYDSFGKYAVLYRGGYDEKNRCGFDPYDRISDPLAKAKGYVPLDKGVADGFLLHIGSSYTKAGACEFLFGKEFDPNKNLIENRSFKVCFDACGRLVIFNADADDPVRVSKTLNRKSAFLKEWMTHTPYSSKDYPVCVNGWKFKRGTEYTIVDINLRYLGHLLPVETEKLGMYTSNWGWMTRACEYQELLRKLYELDPINLDDSWDWSPEQKVKIAADIQEIREKQEREQDLLEERKNTPGFCCMCGREGASYVANPYDEEMYGTINMEWLCDDCYHECAMDV